MDHYLPTDRAAFCTVRDITERCKFSRSHLYNLLDRAAFPRPAVQLGTRFTRWFVADVDAWLADPAAWIAANEPAAAETAEVAA